MVSKGEITGLIQKEEKDLFCFGIAKIYGQKQLNIKEWSHIFFIRMGNKDEEEMGEVKHILKEDCSAIKRYNLFSFSY